MIIGINLNHDYAYCSIEKGTIYVREIERISRIRHHWNETSFTLSLLDDFSVEKLQEIEAIFINSPRVFDIRDKNGNLSSPKRKYTYVGDYPNVGDKKGISYGKIITENIEIKAAWVSHYHAHSASAYFTSPYENADIICLDGGGDFGYRGWFNAKKYSIALSNRYLDNELGLSYHFFSHKVYNKNNGFFESKVMALASYGKKEFSETQYLKDDTTLDLDSNNTKISIHDIAKFQHQFEKGVLDLVKEGNKTSENLCCVGGCFLNVGLNRILAESQIYKNIFIPPYPSDMGTAIGCALYACIDLKKQFPNNLNSAFLGDEISVSLSDLKKLIADYGDEFVKN